MAENAQNTIIKNRFPMLLYQHREINTYIYFPNTLALHRFVYNTKDFSLSISDDRKIVRRVEFDLTAREHAIS
jgi:hypothetical protein